MRHLLTSSLVLATLSACTPAPEGVTISDPRLNPPLGGRDVGAAYMTFTNTGAPTAIVAVTSPEADSIELHESTRTDGIARMDKRDTIPLPVGDTVLQQGGLHLMIFGLTAEEAADGIVLDIQLDNGEVLNVVAN